MDGAGQEGLARRIKDRALAEGFSACGICAPDAIPRRRGGSRPSWRRAGTGGCAGWRSGWGGAGQPAALWPAARSVIMLAEVYTPEEDPLAVLARRDRGAVSVYARGRDYHDLVKPRLKRLGRWLVAETGAEIKVFVDTAPVMEKPLAEAAGIGWQGKHTNLLSPRARQLVLPRRDLHHAGAAAGRAGSGSLRVVPGVPRRLPDRGAAGALPARCAAVHQLSDDRARRAGGRRSCGRCSATASTAATTAWRSARGTSSRRRRGRRDIGRGRRWRRRGWRIWRRSTTPGSGR